MNQPDRPTASTITDEQLDALYEQLDLARRTAVALEQECARQAAELAAVRARLVAELERAHAAAAAARGHAASLAGDGIVAGLKTALRLLDGAAGYDGPQQGHENGQAAPGAPGSPPEASRGAETGVRPADRHTAAQGAAPVRATATRSDGHAASRPHDGPQSAGQPVPAPEVHLTRERPPQSRCEPRGENPKEDQP